MAPSEAEAAAGFQSRRGLSHDDSAPVTPHNAPFQSYKAGFESRVCFAAGNVKKRPAEAGLFTRGLPLGCKLGCSVANLDAGPIPNASIPIPNGRASDPVAVRHVHRPDRYKDGGRIRIPV